METVVVRIKSIEFDNLGQMVIVAQPNEHNPKGTYVINAAMERRLLQRCNVPDAALLKDLVDLSNGSATLNYTAKKCVAGEAWTNERNGTSGVYTKDWTQFSNHEVNLSFAAKMKLTELRAQFSFANAAPRTAVTVNRKVAAPAGPESDSGAEDNGSGPDPIV